MALRWMPISERHGKSHSTPEASILRPRGWRVALALPLVLQLQPMRQVRTKRRFVRKMHRLDPRLEKAEAAPVRTAIHHTRIAPIIPELANRRGQNIGATAHQFILPADDAARREKIAQALDDLGSWFEDQHEVPGAGRDFRRGDLCTIAGQDAFHPVIAERRSVKHCADFLPMRDLFKRGLEMLIGPERHDFRAGDPALDGCAHPSKTSHFTACLGEMTGQHRSQFPSGKVGDSAYFIDRFVTGPTRDNNSHIRRFG